MRLPRDVSGAALVAALRRLGYERVHQLGSHVRVTTQMGGEHHEVVPLHDPIPDPRVPLHDPIPDPREDAFEHPEERRPPSAAARPLISRHSRAESLP